MTINNSHKEFIEATISHLFDDLPNESDNLRTEVSKIVQAINSHTQGEYEPFSRVFQNPTLILRIEKVGGALSIGEAREYMIKYVGTQIQSATNNIECSLESIGWSPHEILQFIEYRGDHNTKLVTERLSTRGWQWHEHSPEANRLAIEPTPQQTPIANAQQNIVVEDSDAAHLSAIANVAPQSSPSFGGGGGTKSLASPSMIDSTQMIFHTMRDPNRPSYQRADEEMTLSGEGNNGEGNNGDVNNGDVNNGDGN